MTHSHVAPGFRENWSFVGQYRAMEQRTKPRYRVLKAGAIEFGGSKLECLVRNISSIGAAIEIKSPLWFPDSFTLYMVANGSCRRCHVVWRQDKRLGVAFDD